MELVIGDKNLSSWSLRPWLVMKRTGAPFTETVVRLDQPGTTAEILRHSPTGQVPALHFDGGEAIWDSMAISVLLAERFPEAGMWPADPIARAYARAAACEMHSGFASLRGECPMNLKRRVKVEVSEATQKNLRRLVELFTAMRARFGAGGPYLFGQWSVADAFYTPVATRIRSYGLVLSDYGDTGVAGEYVSALLQHPDFLEWEAAALADPLARD
ncbi:MAG: glutathione S-transferase family protein [Proteobacteria bacterium]|nr:glutathione S-transferase family protein [Pseudomonadota bacterium]